MNKKALLVAVDDYGAYGKLGSPVAEMARWSALLQSEPYGFAPDQIRTCADAEATLDNVKKELTWLFEAAGPDDQLVFYFCGHGSVARVFDDVTGQPLAKWQETLILYPGSDPDLRKAALSERTILRLMQTAGVSPEADVTFIADCCFSGNFSGDDHGTAAMFVPDIDVPFDFIDRSAIALYGALSETLTEESKVARPLIVAACQPFGLAYEVVSNGASRSLFSLRALQALGRVIGKPADERLTYNELIREINPLSEDQWASLRGNRDRAGERFPGDPSGAKPKPAPIAFDTRKALRTRADASAVSSINVQFDGLCCLVDRRADSDPFAKRVVLPHDRSGKHIAFLEIAKNDILTTDAADVDDYPHEPRPDFGGTVLYSRWILTTHAVTITNIAASGGLTTTAAYERHVPQLRKVLPELNPHPRAECYDTAAHAGLIAGFFDIVTGTLDIGPLYEKHIAFRPQREWLERRQPEYAVLQLPIADASAAITITNLANSSDVKTITLKPGTASIRIGNEQELDITGPGSGESPATYFGLFYRLEDPFHPLPTPLPLPAVGLAPINACSPTNWP